MNSRKSVLMKPLSLSIIKYILILFCFLPIGHQAASAQSEEITEEEVYHFANDRGLERANGSKFYEPNF